VTLYVHFSLKLDNSENNYNWHQPLVNSFCHFCHKTFILQKNGNFVLIRLERKYEKLVILLHLAEFDCAPQGEGRQSRHIVDFLTT
jgi:hypothetical protein